MAINKMVSIVAFIAAVVLANYLTTQFGFVSVGFGLFATAGTYAAGCALVARDFVQETIGLRGVWVALGLGAAFSFLLADSKVALASSIAFTVSELADFLVYTPLRRNRWRLAVVASSVVGAIIDTAIFLGFAFGVAAITPQVMAGQLVGKVFWVAIPVALVGG